MALVALFAATIHSGLEPDLPAPSEASISAAEPEDDTRGSFDTNLPIPVDPNPIDEIDDDDDPTAGRFTVRQQVRDAAAVRSLHCDVIAVSEATDRIFRPPIV